jgi:uncharacterized YccA/Bax inhibitor family protein
MKREVTWMIAASILGALVGAYFMANLKPLNNAGYFVVIFALIGVAVGNLALLALYKVYETYYANPQTQPAPT